MVSCKLE